MMKGMLLTAAGLAVGGATWFGMDGPDFDRVVNRRPIEVYAAFSRLAQEGTITEGRSDAVDRVVSLRVAKELGESITYEILFDDRPVVTAELAFAAAGEQTRMTAELEIDEYELGSAFETEGGVALSLVPETLIDIQFANFMDDMVRDVEAGRPLPALNLGSAGIRRHNPEADVDLRRASAERARIEASRPDATARPMVDPDRAAQDYLNGRPGRDNWGK